MGASTLSVCIAALVWTIGSSAANTTRFALPTLPGPYAVGSTRIQVTDYTRQDPLVSTPGFTPRTLMLQLWYPIATNSSLQQAPYLPEAAAKVTESKFFLPSGSTSKIDTNTFANGVAINPLLTNTGSLPVAVFSPGSGVLSALYTSYTSPLASHGYFIVGVDHTHDSSPVELANGTVITASLGDTNATVNEMAAIVRRDDLLWLSTQLTLKNLYSWLPGFELTKKGPNPTVRLAVFGQSLGGTATALTLQNDTSPYVAGFSLDGPFYGPIVQSGFRGPFFYLQAQEPLVDKASLDTVWAKVRGWKQAVRVNGTTHFDYSDIPVILPIAPDSLLAKVYGPREGPLASGRKVQIMTTYLKAFFDSKLLGRQTEKILLGNSTEFPEVEFEKFNTTGFAGATPGYGYGSYWK
jgi:Platelet-activating factor acetylhydrolase, isoform II